MNAKTVHLADPEHTVKDIVESRLFCSNIKVVHYSDCDSLIRKLTPESFGVILLDLGIPPDGGFHAMDALRDNGVQMPIITYTQDADIETVKEAFRKGAVDFIDQGFADQAFVNSVKVWMEKEEARQPSAEQAHTVRTMLGGLTGREIQVMNALCEGLTGKEVAAALGIAPRTVEVHRSNILHKMECRSLVQLVQKLQRANYFDGRATTSLVSAK
jgi:two-component system response regulator FixJ